MRSILAILLLKLALGSVQISSSFEALNISCINASYLISNKSDGSLLVNLPTFFRASLEVDLRHILSAQSLEGISLSVFINNTDTESAYSETLPLSIAARTFSLFAANNLLVSARFTITGSSTEEVVGKSYLVSRSVSFRITKADPLGQAQDSFLFIVTNTDLISLPYNMVSSANANNFDGYFLSEAAAMGSLRSRQTVIPSYSDYWNGLQSVALPYIPYLSNCEDQGDYLFFSQLTHNSSYCQLYGDSAVPINEFSFGSTATADTCRFSTRCIYDEIPTASNEYPFWNTLGTVDDVLFSITATEQSGNSLLGSFESTEVVPCVLKGTGGSNSSGSYPLKVSLEFGYYQMSSTQRRMITCEVYLSLYTESRANFTYELEIGLAPLSHTQVLLNFGFRWYIYMLVFIIIGLISNFEFLLFWGYHLVVTIKERRNFNLRIYLTLVSEILKGVIPAAIISVFLTFLVEVVMNGTLFGTPLFGSFCSFWNYLILGDIGLFAGNIEGSTQAGRMGFAYVVVAVYLMVVLSELLIGKERRPEDYQEYEILGRRLKPVEWNRGKLVFVTVVYVLFSIYFLYFTYTSVFSEQIWLIIAFLQIFQMVCEEVVYSILDDKLPCTPLKLTFGVLAYLATMGAIDLYYFILGYLVDVGISIIEITYLSQLQEKIKDFIEQKIDDLNRLNAKIFNDERDDQDRKGQAKPAPPNNEEILLDNPHATLSYLQKEVEEEHNELNLEELEVFPLDEAVRRRFLEYALQSEKFEKDEREKKGTASANQEEYEREKREFENKKFELIIDGATGMMQYLIQPIVVLILWITYSTSTILSNFQISDENAILYLLSSIILAFFFQINVIIIFHVLELYLNTDYDYQFRQLLSRFDRKTTFWITDEQNADSTYEIKLRGIHSYSISSQLFFVVGLYTISVYLLINGVITIISASFNPFKDPNILLILAFWLAVLELLAWLLRRIAALFDIWGYSSLSEKRRQSIKLEEHFSSDQETNQILKSEDMYQSSIKFTFKRIEEPVEKVDQRFEREKRLIARAKLVNVCKKLVPQFEKEDFRLKYAIQNKDFIRQNIEKILPLVGSFPTDDTAWIGKGNVIDKKDLKKQNKNCDPLISDFLTYWMKRVETNRAKRQQEGVEHERKLKKCRFCFQTWGLYYGYDGVCLKCSRHLFINEQNKKNK